MKNKSAPQISDQAVREKTGKGWAEWFNIINDAGGSELSHKEVVAFLKSEYQLNLWWQQMVTVTYEQQTGKREKHQMSDGYQISKSKTFDKLLPVLWKAWITPHIRQQWLEHASITIGKTTEYKSLRLKWVDGKSVVEVQFYPKGETKTQLTVQHHKINDRKQAERLKKYWQQQLNNLTVLLNRQT